MRTWHVLPNLCVKALLSRQRRAVSVAFVVDTQNDVEELDEGALPVVSARQLSPLTLSVTLVVKDAPWQTCRSHVFASGEERSDAVVEGHGIAPLVHPLEKVADIMYAFLECVERPNNDPIVSGLDGVGGSYHRIDYTGALGLHCYADEEEPRLGLCPRERAEEL